MESRKSGYSLKRYMPEKTSPKSWFGTPKSATIRTPNQRLFVKKHKATGRSWIWTRMMFPFLVNKSSRKKPAKRKRKKAPMNKPWNCCMKDLIQSKQRRSEEYLLKQFLTIVLCCLAKVCVCVGWQGNRNSEKKNPLQIMHKKA